MMLFLLACSERFQPEDTARERKPAVDSAADDTADTGADEPLGLCINELMPDNEASIRDDTELYPDWIELHNPGDTAIRLAGWTISDYRLDPARHTLGELVLAPGGFLVLWADERPEVGPTHLAFALDADGGEVALYAPDGRGTILTYGPIAADFSLTRVPDCCTGDGCLTYDFRGTPGESNVEPIYEDVTLLAAGSTWSYWDQGTNPGAGWQAAGFDASTWPLGAAPLGYGDAHIVTTVGYGADPNVKHVTTWFRTTFAAPNVALADATVSLLRDDGAVVYLNGVEVARSNLPEGELTEATLAPTAAAGADETAYFEFALPVEAIVPGTNTVAVELHQAAQTSTDLGFDLVIGGRIVVTP